MGSSSHGWTRALRAKHGPDGDQLSVHGPPHILFVALFLLRLHNQPLRFNWFLDLLHLDLPSFEAATHHEGGDPDIVDGFKVNLNAFQESRNQGVKESRS